MHIALRITPKLFGDLLTFCLGLSLGQNFHLYRKNCTNVQIYCNHSPWGELIPLCTVHLFHQIYLCACVCVVVSGWGGCQWLALLYLWHREEEGDKLTACLLQSWNELEETVDGTVFHSVYVCVCVGVCAWMCRAPV